MGRIVSNFFMSIDGVVEQPGEWQGDMFDPAIGEIMSAGMQRQRGFLLGRKLYDEWSSYWPTSQDEFAAYINAIPKYVLSNTLTEATWENTTIISGPDVAARVRELKDSTEGDIGMSGSATTVRWLLSEGLLDELAMLVHPIALGRGQRLFEDTPTVRLELLHSTALSNGTLHLRYAPVKA